MDHQMMPDWIGHLVSFVHEGAGDRIFGVVTEQRSETDDVYLTIVSDNRAYEDVGVRLDQVQTA